MLEAGCGTGGNLAMLARFGKLEAFELDEEARAIAQTKQPIAVKYGMLPDGIPFSPGTFDVVTAFDVIEHVEQDLASLTMLAQQLSPGGRLIMTVPALPWLWSRHDETHHHYRRYTRQSLLATLRQAGLHPLRVSYFNTLLFPFIAGLRVLRKHLHLKETADDAMPGAGMNAVLKAIFGAESALIGRFNFPIGVSLMAVAERPHE